MATFEPSKPSEVMKDIEGYITPEQIDKILAATKSERDRMLVNFGWRTGRRITEILNVKKRDIDFDKGLVKFRILKKKKPDYFVLKPIDNKLLGELKVYTQHLDPEAYIFPSPYSFGMPLSRKQAYNIIRDAAERAGIYQVGLKPMHPHVLRHSFAVNFIRRCTNKSVALILLKGHLEHSSVSMTLGYTKFNQDDMRAELDNMFSKEDKL